MPRINLSNVSDGELQRLLDAGRVRGDATLREVIEQEIAARAEGPAPKINRHRQPVAVAVKVRRSPSARRAVRAQACDPQRLARLYEEGVQKLEVANPPR